PVCAPSPAPPLHAALPISDEPPASTPLALSAPAAGSDLPDMGSPAAAVLSHTDEYRLGAMVARELRDQNALLEDPEVSEYMSWRSEEHTSELQSPDHLVCS